MVFVSNAFRRFPRSPQDEDFSSRRLFCFMSPMPFGVFPVHHTKMLSAEDSIFPSLQCLSAFSPFTTPLWTSIMNIVIIGLQCLSAFSPFTTTHQETRSAFQSPRLQCLSAFSPFTTDSRKTLNRLHLFCLQCLSAFSPFTTQPAISQSAI